MLLLLLAFVGLAAAIPIDNGVLVFQSGAPNPVVTCGNEGFDLLVSVQNNAFFRGPTPDGRLFIKGLASATPAGCVSFQVSNNQMVLARIDYDKCPQGITSRREPEGVTRTVTLILSFHPFFITKVDRAFEVNCQYRQPMKEVTVPLGVSMIPTQSIGQSLTMPECIYQILDQETERPIRYAQIGDKVLHRWTCDGGPNGATQWCMRVHSCGLTGEPSPRFSDQDGCSKDPFILGNAAYEPGALEAEVEAHVFKLPDVPDLGFRCSIRLMPRRPGQQCARPACPPLGLGSRSPTRPLPRPRRATGNQTQEAREVEVDGRLSVLELEAGAEEDAAAIRRLLRRANGLVEEPSPPAAECVSSSSVLAAAVGCVAFGLFSVSALLAAIWRYATAPMKT